MTSNSNRKLIHSFAALADLGQEIADANDFREMIRTSLHLLLGSLALQYGALAEFRWREEHFEFIAQRGLSGATLPPLRVDGEDVGDLRHLGLVGLTLHEGKSEQLFRFCLRHQTTLRASRAEILIPLVMGEQLVGLVLLGGKLSGEPITDEDRDILCALARHIGVGLQRYALKSQVQEQTQQNRELYDNLRNLNRSTVRALATAMDFKDKVMQGHAENVGLYCRIIAREMGWREEEVEGITTAGYLHDIGKLVVERELINAPYPINAKRSNELSQHPIVGYEILRPITHPFIDIAATARYHHERLDGTGYPDGLTAERIPMSAKIVAVADAFDEMMTDHPYRRGFALETACAELRQHAGTQFAPEVVVAFSRALLKEIDAESTDKRLVKMLRRDYLHPQRLAPQLEQLIKELA